MYPQETFLGVCQPVRQNVRERRRAGDARMDERRESKSRCGARQKKRKREEGEGEESNRRLVRDEEKGQGKNRGALAFP